MICLQIILRNVSNNARKLMAIDEYKSGWTKKAIRLNPKTVLRVINKYDLLCEIRRCRKYKYVGQQLHRHDNILKRNFYADKPNQKWVTDISFIHTGQGVLYLSIIRDLYDSSIVAYRTGAEQSVNLVLTIREARTNEKVTTGL